MTLLNGRDLATPAPSIEQVVDQPAPVPAAKRTRVSRVAGAASVERPAAASAPKLVMTIPVSAPELHQRMKPVLARGTKLPLAAEGFTSAEQFATLAHAARNTQVPFILLKHRVLTDGQSLEDAIRASKPDADARLEADRARTAAKADIRALTSNVSTLSSN
jgi:hypothetical protein